MEFKEFTAKNVDDAITEACEALMVTSDRLEYEVVSAGSTGFLGINAKPAVIKARIKEEIKETSEVKEPVKEVAKEVKKEAKEVVKESASKVEETKEEVKVSKTNSTVNADACIKKANDFLKDVFGAMNMEVNVNSKFNASDNVLDVELSGAEMGVLIGKRGQTLDSLQYLISLVINKYTDKYIRVKVDTENYRERRKQTLENLARNIAKNVKRTRRATTLEPMNPYERRIIHSALQGDKYVETHSEGEEPYRKVVISPKRG